MNDNEQIQIIITAAVIINKNYELLLLKRRNDLQRSPGRWELPSGKVDFGEKPAQALARVVHQKTGLNVTADKLIGSTSFVSKQSGQHILIFYNMAKLVDGYNPHPIVTDDQEHTESTWCNENNLQQMTLEKHLKAIIPKIRTHMNNNINKLEDDIVIRKYDKLIIYTDGGSRGNPGPSASGFIISDENDKIIEEGGEYLGLTTNNQAEYQAVKLALKETAKYSPEEIELRIDSLLVVNQMTGKFRIRNRELWPIHDYIKKEIAKYRRVNFVHIPREMNEAADAKVNEVLDSQEQ